MQTGEGTSVLLLPNFAGTSSHTANLTESFQVSAQVGMGSRFGSISISVIERTSYRTVGSTAAVGAGDFAIISN